MLWSIKIFAIFFSDHSRLRDVSSPPDASPDAKASPAPIPPLITESRPDLKHGKDSLKTCLCSCGYQRLDFCPYCDYDQKTSQVQDPFVPEPPSPTPNVEDSIMTPTHYDFLNSPPRPRMRKLRKFRPDYQHLQHESSGGEGLVSAQPDSDLATHSRTPLLNRALSSNPNYPPLPSDCRNSKKLEKKNRKRSLSMSDPSRLPYTSLSSSSSDPAVVRSKSFLQTKNLPSSGPRPKPVSSSIDTDDLVSLAWTGVALSPRSSHFYFSGSEGSESGPSAPCIDSRPASVTSVQEARPDTHLPPEVSRSNLSKRRSTLRKTKAADVQNHQPSPRPWTLAMAIADDGISDEKFVDDLEDIRIKEEPNELRPADPYPPALSPAPPYQTQLLDCYAEYPLQSQELGQDSNPAPDSSWTSARQALLLCRELIRTESRYISSLKTLITNGTISPPPLAMLPYLPGLITAGEAFLQLMKQNPSVQGVSEALLASSSSLNDAFVAWCRVVGHFFDSQESGIIKSDSEEAAEPSLNGKLRNPRSRPTSMPTQSSENGLSVVIPEPNKIRRNTKTRPTVRHLAIQPTQRIMRYVLLFKELHSLTPITHSSFIFVEQALQVTRSIAQAANGAQGHAAFKQPNI